LGEHPPPRLLSSYVLCFILLHSRHYQRERWCVIRWNERLAVNSAPIPYRSLGIALCFTPNLIKGEPTSGLEPLTCSLGVNCSSWTILCFILFDNRRYQRERRSVRRCNERLLIGEPLVDAAEDQHLKEASRRPFELPSLLRDSSPKVSPQQTTGKVFKSTSRQDEACGSAVYVVTCFSFTCSPPSV
jgi:hypothetical protein